MKHAKMLWNFNIRQRFCTTCGRTSDHVVELDARIEMDQFDCQLPYVEVPVARPGEETVQVAFRYTNGQLGQYAWGAGILYSSSHVLGPRASRPNLASPPPPL
jgi:hypothetical protein